MSSFWARGGYLDTTTKNEHLDNSRDYKRDGHDRRHSSSSRSVRSRRRSGPHSPIYEDRHHDRRSPARSHHSRGDGYPRSRSRDESYRQHEEEYVVAFRKEYEIYCRESREKLREEPFPYIRWLDINKRTPQFYEKYQRYRKREQDERKSPLSYVEWQKYRQHVKERKAGGWPGYKPPGQGGGDGAKSGPSKGKEKKSKEQKEGGDEPLEPGELPSSDEEDTKADKEPARGKPVQERPAPNHDQPRPPLPRPPNRGHRPPPPARESRPVPNRPPFERRDVSQPEPKKECPVVMIEPQIRDLIAANCIVDPDVQLSAHPHGSIHNKPINAYVQTPGGPANPLNKSVPTTPVPAEQPEAQKTPPKSPATANKPDQRRGGGQSGPRGKGPAEAMRPPLLGRGPRPPAFGAPGADNPNFIPLGPRQPAPADQWYGPPPVDTYGYGPPRGPYGPDYGPPGGHYQPPSFGRPPYPGYGPPRPSPPRFDYPGYGPPRPLPPYAGYDFYGPPPPGHYPYPPYEDPYYWPPQHRPHYDPYAYPPGHPSHFGPGGPPPPGHYPHDAYNQPRPPPPPDYRDHDPYEHYRPMEEVEGLERPEPESEPMSGTASESKEDVPSGSGEKDSDGKPIADNQNLGLRTLKLQELMDRKREDLFQLTRLKKNAQEFKNQYNDWMSKYDVWKRENGHHPTFKSISSEWEGWIKQLTQKMSTTEEMIKEADQRIKTIDQLQMLLTIGDVDPNMLKDVELKTNQETSVAATSKEVKTDQVDNLGIEFDEEPLIEISRESRQEFLIVVQQCRNFLTYLDALEELYPYFPPLIE